MHEMQQKYLSPSAQVVDFVYTASFYDNWSEWQAAGKRHVG